MTFNPLIPQSGDPILQSYYQLRANFQTINSAFAEDHVGLTQNQDFAGMHNVLTFQPLPSPFTDPTTSANQIALYNKLVSGVPELFFRPTSNQTPIQMTFPQIQTGLQSTNPDIFFPTQYSFIAGPFIIYGGFITGATSGQNVTLFPGTTLLYVNLVANVALPSLIAPTNITGTTFTISFSSGSTSPLNIFYFAVGI